MQIHISPRDIKLTPALNAYVANKVSHLEHYSDSIIGAHIAIHHDTTRAGKHAFVIKVHLAMPGPDLHGEDRGHDLYQAVDLVVERLAEQLRHRKNKITKGARQAARKAKGKPVAEELVE
jgi:putative sigma-54 modulation protein